MPQLSTDTNGISLRVSHSSIAVFTLAGMLVAWGVASVHGQHATGWVLLITIAIASLPLCIELAHEIRKGNFGIDILAALSIGSAVAFGEYWVAAIVILMLSGGKSLEEYATAARVFCSGCSCPTNAANRTSHRT